MTADAKTCTKCGVEKPLDQFSRNSRASDGRQSQCKACFAAYRKVYREANKEKIVAQQKAYRAANAEKESARKKAHYEVNREQYVTQQKAHKLRARYGLTVEQYDAMVEGAGGVCEICKQPPPTTSIAPNRVLHVDHDHVTGEVRGLLCSACNRSIGLIGDENLAKAAAYVEADRDLRGMSPTPAPIPRMVGGKPNPIHTRDRQLRRRYGIDFARFGVLNAAQGGRCGICDEEPPADNKLTGNRVLHVDHDHITGAVRGLLCHTCNKALGQIGDENLAAAAAYIERTTAPALGVAS